MLAPVRPLPCLRKRSGPATRSHLSAGRPSPIRCRFSPRSILARFAAVCTSRKAISVWRARCARSGRASSCATPTRPSACARCLRKPISPHPCLSRANCSARPSIPSRSKPRRVAMPTRRSSFCPRARQALPSRCCTRSEPCSPPPRWPRRSMARRDPTTGSSFPWRPPLPPGCTPCCRFLRSARNSISKRPSTLRVMPTSWIARA